MYSSVAAEMSVKYLSTSRLLIKVSMPLTLELIVSMLVLITLIEGSNVFLIKLFILVSVKSFASFTAFSLVFIRSS